MRKLGTYTINELSELFRNSPIIYPDNRYGCARIIAKFTMPTKNFRIPPITIWATSGQVDGDNFFVYGLIRCIPNQAHYQLINLTEQIQLYGGADYDVLEYHYKPLVATLEGETDVPKELLSIEELYQKYDKIEADYILLNEKIAAEETADGEPLYDEEYYGEPCEIGPKDVFERLEIFIDSEHFELYGDIMLCEWTHESIIENPNSFIETICNFLKKDYKDVSMELPPELRILINYVYAFAQMEGNIDQRIILANYCDAQRKIQELYS